MSKSTKISVENRDKYIEIGLNIAFYRKRIGMTQEQLAEKANLSRNFVSAIEAPNLVKALSLEALFNIADALNVEPSKLLEFRD
ncbi:MAG: helix-turn-helix transcriptional regulator [Clostridia bacterium]|nr:helix-turn-helix transcriptional regulator [Clostridia bacterium]